MEFVYLGLFSRVFNWVLDKIFEPVFKFISNLLSTVFNWIFNEILAPILMPILQSALEFFIELFLEIFSVFIYGIFAGFLKLIDYFQIAFDVFIGIEDVTYVQKGGVTIKGSLVDVLMQQESVSTVFWVITLGALGIALMLTIYATAQSAFDLDFENKRPVSKVLTAMMKTFIRFFTVPFMVLFVLKLSALILRGMMVALKLGTGETSLGRIVFLIASLDAAIDPSYNISTSKSMNIGATDRIRSKFYDLNGGLDYANINQVEAYFDLAKFDYLIGFLAAIFLFFTIGICLIIFIQRIFEIILLYIVSPYFVCTMPLDDGEKYSKWQEMFIGKCFTGFGSAIGMRLYLMICPIIMGNQLTFGTADNPSSPEMDYLMKLFFLAGGAWAVYKSGSMITTLISYQAGTTEASTAAVAGGVLYGHTVGRAIGAGKSLIGRGNQAIKHKVDTSGRDQAYKGDKRMQGALKDFHKAGGVNPKQVQGLSGKPGVAGKRQIPKPPNYPPPTPPTGAGKRQIPSPPNYPPPAPPTGAGKRQIPKPPNYPPPAPPNKNLNRPLPPIPGQVSSGRRHSISGGVSVQVQTGVSLNTLASRRASWSAGSGVSAGSYTSASFSVGSHAANYGGSDTGRFKSETHSISSIRADERHVLSVAVSAGSRGSTVSTGSTISTGSTASASSAGTQSTSFKSQVPNGKLQVARLSSTGQFTGGKG